MIAVRTRLGLIIACLCALCCASCGPRMRVQQSIKPFERPMPDMPLGSVPIDGRTQKAETQVTTSSRNPLQPTPSNLNAGRIYYGYYCLMCHGVNGDGNGPVGQGYVPKPTDLSSPSVTALTDGEYYIRMLTGKGHSPIGLSRSEKPAVMEQTVLPEHRWPLVLYARNLPNTRRLPPAAGEKPPPGTD